MFQSRAGNEQVREVQWEMAGRAFRRRGFSKYMYVSEKAGAEVKASNNYLLSSGNTKIGRDSMNIRDKDWEAG